MADNRLDFITQIKNKVWGGLGGNLSDQADLKSALDGKQPLDADLTAVADLSPVNDDIIQRKAGAWTNRTMAELAADLITLAQIASPTFTGTPAGPTAAVSTDTTQLATTAFVMAQRGDIPSGATLPASPVANQLFLHTPTGRRVLMIYTGSTWYPLYSYGTMTLYVDGTLGTDSANLGYGTGANAYKTLSYAWTQLPSTYYGNSTINVAAGTYAETLTCQGKTAGGAFTISIVGAYSTLDSGTATSGVAGTGATLATMTDTSKSWTTNQFAGKFVTVSGVTGTIVSNTSDTLTLLSAYSSAPSGDYTIQEPSVIIAPASGRTLVLENQSVNFLRIQFNKSASPSRIRNWSSVEFTNCIFYDNTAITQNFVQVRSFSSFTMTRCSMLNDSAITQISIGDYSNALIRGVFFTKSGSVGGVAIAPNVASLAMNVLRNYITGYSIGINCVSATARVASPLAGGYNYFTNCNTALFAENAGQITGTANNQYSGNTTDENAVAASYGFID